MRRAARFLALSMVLAPALVGCAEAQRLVDGDAVDGPGNPLPECFARDTSVEPAPPRQAAQVLANTDYLVIGMVTDEIISRFNTPDGSNPFTREDGPDWRPEIITIHGLSVERVIHGDAVGTDSFAVLGGTVGCISSTVSDVPLFRVDGRYLFLLADGRYADGSVDPDAPLLIAAWPAGADGRIGAPDGTWLTIDDIQALLGDA